MDFSNIVYDYSNVSAPARETYFIPTNQVDYENYIQGNKSIEGPSYYRKNLKQIHDGSTRQYIVGSSKEYFDYLNNHKNQKNNHILIGGNNE